jgi:hypothetical protein
MFRLLLVVIGEKLLHEERRIKYQCVSSRENAVTVSERQDRQYTYNIITRLVRETILVVEKQ